MPKNAPFEVGLQQSEVSVAPTLVLRKQIELIPEIMKRYFAMKTSILYNISLIFGTFRTRQIPHAHGSKKFTLFLSETRNNWKTWISKASRG